MKQSIILIFILTAMFQFARLPSYAQRVPSFKNRIGINLLGLPAENLVLSYEHSFRSNGLWLGLEARRLLLYTEMPFKGMGF